MALGSYRGIGPMWGSMYNYQLAGDATRAAQKGLSKVRQIQTELKRVEDKLDKLTLVCMAMWSLLCEKTELTEQDLSERVQKLDLDEGKGDGQGTGALKECPTCARTMSSRHARCLYCGEERSDRGPFGI